MHIERQYGIVPNQANTKNTAQKSPTSNNFLSVRIANSSGSRVPSGSSFESKASRIIVAHLFLTYKVTTTKKHNQKKKKKKQSKHIYESNIEFNLFYENSEARLTNIKPKRCAGKLL